MPRVAAPAQFQGPSINSPSHACNHLKTALNAVIFPPIHNNCPTNSLVLLSSRTFHHTCSINSLPSEAKQSHNELLRRPLVSPLLHIATITLETQSYISKGTFLISLVLLSQRWLFFILQTPASRWLYPESNPQTQAPDTRSLGLCTTTPFQGFYGSGCAVDQCRGCVA